MTRTRITFTADSSKPRVLHLGAAVVWYVYLRATATNGLYLQKSVSGVLGAETLVASDVSEVDAIIDPDGTRAWIYFTTDGALRCIEVTTLSETPSTQFFQRQVGWYERVPGGLGGHGLQGDFGFTDEVSAAWRTDDGPVELYPPRIALFDIGSPTQLLLIIDRGSVRYGVVNKFRAFMQSDHDGAGWSWYADVTLPTGTTQVYLLVPKSVYPAVDQWVATAVRYTPAYESAWSNVVSQIGWLDLVTGKLGGMGTQGQWALVDKTPIKYAAPIDSYAPGALGAAGTQGQWALVDKTPIKYAAPIDSYTPGAFGAAGVGCRWSLNGVDVIAP